MHTEVLLVQFRVPSDMHFIKLKGSSRSITFEFSDILKKYYKFVFSQQNPRNRKILSDNDKALREKPRTLNHPSRPLYAVESARQQRTSTFTIRPSTEATNLPRQVSLIPWSSTRWRVNGRLWKRRPSVSSIPFHRLRMQEGVTSVSPSILPLSSGKNLGQAYFRSIRKP